MLNSHVMPLSDMAPELISFARMVCSEETIANQNIAELHKRKYLCLLGFPKAKQSTIIQDDEFFSQKRQAASTLE